MEDKQIVKLFFDRSESAIDVLSNKYGKAMFSLSYGILGNVQDAEECLNDSYLGVWNAIPPADPEHLFAFVCRITRNISLAKHRYNKAEKRDPDSTISFEEIGDCIPSPSFIPESVGVSEITKSIDIWLEKLNKNNLYIFVRRYWYMDSVSKISKDMSMTEASIYLRLDRMKKNLFSFLKKQGVIE